jgi:single-stranded-DNA-specific exonuclease
LPDAVALVNPKLPMCDYPNKDLAGVGVAFQLLRALYQAQGRTLEDAHQFLDLVMLGTVADLVPLMRNGEVENHEMVKAGLRHVANGHGNLGLKTLMSALNMDANNPAAGQLSFVISPHLNAANRVGDPRVALLLLTTPNPKLAEYLSETLVAYNRDRKQSQSKLSSMVNRAIEDGQIDLDRERLIWLEGENWNPGILGLVASYVVDAYRLPVILISREGAMSRASARSVGTFNMIHCLETCSDIFRRFGGHAMAAGFTIDTPILPDARERVLAYARENMDNTSEHVHEIDVAVRATDISLDLHTELPQLAPFGVGNPTPKFLLPRASMANLKTVGDGRHLKFVAKVGDISFETIGF